MRVVVKSDIYYYNKNVFMNGQLTFLCHMCVLELRQVAIHLIQVFEDTTTVVHAAIVARFWRGRAFVAIS